MAMVKMVQHYWLIDNDRINDMRDKYKNCGLNYDLIIEKYPNISEYEETVNAYLDDEFFNEMKIMIEQEDYAMAKDACKGLYILANDLYLFPLYEALLDYQKRNRRFGALNEAN